MLNRLIDILFCDTQYGIAYKKKTSDTYTTILPTCRYGYADPFIVEHEGKTAIFVELMDFFYGLGTIGVFEECNGSFSKVKEIIREDYHMSFPNVFKHDDELYMIPETYSANNIHLYKCDCFPYKWREFCTLIDNVKIVDCSIIQKESVTYVIGYDIEVNSARVFILDWKSLALKEIFPVGNFSLERQGGNFFKDKGTLKRVIQDCKFVYGDFIKIYSIDQIDEEFFNETFEREVRIDDYSFDVKKQFNHTHHYANSDNYEVIDYKYQKFYFTKFFRFIYKKLFRSGKSFS